jgi:zinc transport system permease protein
MDIFEYSFMVHALAASILASIAFGIVGTYVVVKRIVFISGGISHTAYGGIGLGLLLGIDPMYGAAAFSILAAVAISYLRRKKLQHEDTLIGMMWAFGMALGILIINMIPGYAPNLMSYLFGNILTIPFSDIILMIILDLIILVLTILLFEQFKAITFDDEFSRTLGLPVNALHLLLYIMIALTTVILIKIVGIILVIALLSLPGSISIHFSKSLKGMMVRSTLLGIFFTVGGLLLSYYFNLAGSASIIILAVAAYVVVQFYLRIRKREPSVDIRN